MNRPARFSALAVALAAAGLALEAPLAAAQRGTPPPTGGAGQGQQQARSGRAAADGPSTREGVLKRGTRRLVTSPSTDDRGRTGGGLASDSDESLYPFGYPPEQQQRIYFATVDADSSEWVSFREAEGALRFDADNFCVYDVDNDGRLTFEEFADYVMSESASGRAVREPIRAEYQGSPPQRTAEQLRSAYDVDLDGAIGTDELERMLRDYDSDALQDVDAATILGRLDADGSGVLETSELARVASFLAPLVNDPGGGRPAQPGARSVLEMFGRPIPRGETVPPRIVGPVPPFRRLDLDNNGFVDLADLKALEGGSFLPVRLSGVLNTLDVDYDGRLSEWEFHLSMTRKKRDQ